MRGQVNYLFKDKELLDLMIGFRVQGFSYTTLTLFFSCEKKALRYQCDKYGILPQEEVFSLLESIAPIIHRAVMDAVREEGKWRHLLDGEKINRGKDYKEYLASSRSPRSNS